MLRGEGVGGINEKYSLPVRSAIKGKSRLLTMHIQHNQRLDGNPHASLQIRADEMHKFANLYIGLFQVCRQYLLLNGLLHLGAQIEEAKGNIKCRKNYSNRNCSNGQANKWQNMIFNFATRTKNTFRESKPRRKSCAHKEQRVAGIRECRKLVEKGNGNGNGKQKRS